MYHETQAEFLELQIELVRIDIFLKFSLLKFWSCILTTTEATFPIKLAWHFQNVLLPKQFREKKHSLPY